MSFLRHDSIVCFAHDWDGDPTSKTHIMRVLARDNRILWVNSIGMRRPTASAADFKRIGRKLRQAMRPVREVEPNILVANPLALPLMGLGVAERINRSVLRTWLRALCRRHKLQRPILWSFMPNVSHLLGALDEKLVIYHCVDEYRAFSGVSREALATMEDDLVRRSDLVLTSSARLAAERRFLNPNTHFVSHGVDLRHFHRALDREIDVPEDLRHLPRPVIGFFGLLADWVDQDAIAAVARAHPEWSVVLIGKAVTDLRAISRIPNVHLLGQKPYAVLPDYCRGFDVALLPFVTNELTVRANPLKLREYLAAGLPVVSTPLPEVERYRELIRLAETPGQFVTEVERALEEHSLFEARTRVKAMAAESWEVRVEEIRDLVDRARVEEHGPAAAVPGVAR